VAPVEPEHFRLEKLNELRRLGIEPYGCRFPGRSPLGELRKDFDRLKGQTVRAAGRITNRRAMGKATFMDLKDRTGSIQLFLQLDRVGEEAFRVHKLLEPGDIIGASGELGKTRTGEISIFVDRFELLAKALLSPPEKWHGLRDLEKRCRQRYVDLFTNDDVMATFLKRAELLREMRKFLHERGYVEVETPMMQTIPGGAAARPFLTHLNALDLDLYLRIAPELYLKRLLVGGMEKVFEINRNFRNEGISNEHNPEFTALELYEAYGDYETMMALLEELIPHLAQEVFGSLALPYGEHVIDYTPPWPRRKFWEVFDETFGVDAPAMREQVILRQAAAASAGKDARTSRADAANLDYLAYKAFEREAERRLIQPTFVIDYPRSISPLARTHRDDPSLAERFELYIGGMEVAPAYSELNDPLEQERRLMEQVGEEAERERLDADFLRALCYGMPPAGGLGLGIDRLMMLLANQQSIREVILFPLLRPEEGL